MSIFPILIKVIDFLKLAQKILTQSCSYTLILAIDFRKKIKKKETGNLKDVSAVCMHTFAAGQGFRQGKSLMLCILVLGAGPEMCCVKAESRQVIMRMQFKGRKMFKKKYAKATLTYLCTAATNRNRVQSYGDKLVLHIKQV